MSQPQLPQLEGVDHHSVELPGLRMRVAEAGSGTPVLLLHGFAQHWWEWRKAIPGLAERFRVICPDLRGAGWSDAPRRGYTREQLLADVVALLDALGLDGVHLLAHDYGALVGYQLCLRHPERVRRHLSLGIPPPYFDFDPTMVLALVRRAWYNPLIPVPVLGPRLLGGGRQRLPRPAKVVRSACSGATRSLSPCGGPVAYTSGAGIFPSGPPARRSRRRSDPVRTRGRLWRRPAGRWGRRPAVDEPRGAKPAPHRPRSPKGGGPPRLRG